MFNKMLLQVHSGKNVKRGVNVQKKLFAMPRQGRVLAKMDTKEMIVTKYVRLEHMEMRVQKSALVLHLCIVIQGTANVLARTATMENNATIYARMDSMGKIVLKGLSTEVA